MPKLKKDLSLFGLIMIVIGSVIGSGIFLTPSQIAEHLSTPTSIMLVWGFGGFIVLTGALTFGELGGMFPKTGGVYVYLKEAYGDFIAFSYGWAYFTVIMSGTVAALAIAFSSYMGYLFVLSSNEKSILSILIIILVSALNIFRVKLVEMFTNTFSIMKLLGIVLIIIVGLFFGAVETLTIKETISIPITERNTTSAFGLALIGVLWSFGGWHHASFLSGEAKNANKNIPLAMIIGTGVVLIVYLLTNVAYLSMLTTAEMALSDSLASDALSTVIPFGGILIAIIILISTFGTALVGALTGPRLYLAMSNDGLFFKKLSQVNSKSNTPVNAIVAQGIWAIIILLLWGTFEAVITYVVFIDWIYFFLTAFIVILFRIKRKSAHRTYKTPLFPFTPIVFIVISFLFVINTLAENILYAGAGLALLALSTPFYFYFKHKRKKI